MKKAYKTFLMLKEEYPNHILFFKTKDYAFTFDNDAQLVAKELDLRVVKKMDRIKHVYIVNYQADYSFGLLIKKGYRVIVLDEI